MFSNIKLATIDGKKCKHAISCWSGNPSYCWILRTWQRIPRKPAPKVDLNMGDIGMLSIDILLAMATHDMLIKQGIIPADVMK